MGVASEIQTIRFPPVFMGFSVTPNRPFPYTLKRHREVPEGERPVFRLRHLGSRLWTDLSKLMEQSQGRGAWVVACAGVVGWDRLERDGLVFDFVAPKGPRLVHGITVTGGVDEDCLDAVPIDVVMELAEAIIDANTLDRTSAKN